jgi:DNA-binding PadR family transcriptional regulator
MRRKPGSLVPLELQICAAALDLRTQGTEEFHGFLLAKQLKHASDSRLLTAYGTLYRALSRLETMGLVRSRPEDPMIASRENRPARRLYTLTPNGEAAVRQEGRSAFVPSPTPAEGLT